MHTLIDCDNERSTTRQLDGDVNQKTTALELSTQLLSECARMHHRTTRLLCVLHAVESAQELITVRVRSTELSTLSKDRDAGAPNRNHKLHHILVKSRVLCWDRFLLG